ncbi:MAG: gas vesicle protein [Ammonifex sp.]|nr:MAG: gas vesicle protein [Ammonifex sp.]
MNEVIANEHVTLLELLDRLLNKGVMIWGDLVISVAGIDLVYLRLQVLLSAVETLKGESK